MLDIHIKPALTSRFSNIEQMSPYWVTHSQAWAKVIENSFPHIKAYFVSDKKDIGSDSSFLPLYKIRRPLVKDSWISIPFSTVCDPVLKNGTQAGPFLNALLDNPMLRNNQIEIRSSKLLAGVDRFITYTNYANHQIILDESEEEIFKRFHKKSVQPRIRKALSSGLNLRMGTNTRDVETFYTLYCIMRREQGLPPQPYRFFKNMWDILYPIGNLELLLAEDNGKVISGCWAIKNKWLYSFEYLARAGRNDKKRCTYFLNWHGIKNAIKQNIKIVTFARTSVKNTGLDLYKRSWGTVAMPYYDYKFPGQPEKNREDLYCYQIIKKYSPILPLPLFKFLGRIIYRYI